MSTERPTKPGFYFVDSPDMRRGVPHVVELRENGDIYAIGVVGPIHWPPHLLQNWRETVDAEKSRGAEDLVLKACTKLHCGGASLILNLDRLIEDVGKYDRIRARLRRAVQEMGKVEDLTATELREFLADLKETIDA